MNRSICSGKILIKGLDFKVLSDDEVVDIHTASLEILEKTGVFVEDADALDLFHSIGCRVDGTRKVVKIPHYLVERAIRTAPSRITLGARDPEKSFAMEGKRVTFTSFGEGVNVVDINTGEIRPSTKKDLADRLEMRGSRLHLLRQRVHVAEPSLECRAKEDRVGPSRLVGVVRYGFGRLDREAAGQPDARA